MAVDEFGREVPGGRHHHHHHHHHRRGGSPSPPHSRGDGAPSQLFEALSSSRYGRDDPRPPHSSNNRKRKHRSESPPRGRGGKPSQSHPSTLYAEEPMLCQYLWKEANPGKEEQEYDEYRRSYCLNYVRTFFNEHMDDSWFRSLYSPLGKYRVAVQEQERAVQESRLFQSELETSLAKNQSTDDSTPCFFVLKARLGGGVKQSRNQKDDTNPVPQTHMLGVAGQVLPILEVPAHVTVEQLTAALMSHCTLDKVAVPQDNMTMYSSTPGTDLTRTCYFFAPEEVRKSIINQLNHIGRGDNNTNNAAADGAHVPRKEETYIPKTLELDVECSDAYGRLEVDTDGKGGAPEDGQGISPRKAVVWVSTQPVTPPVKVLSVAVSSKERIEQDKEAAVQLAKAYDTKRNIPKECQLESILPKTFPGSKDSQTEDILDLSIAYLRRVHLFSFYNGCVASSNMADVLSGGHSASTIHLRLSNADEILLQTKDDTATTVATETSNEPPKLDMLVKRLNDAREKAIGLTNEWDGVTCTFIVNEEVDGQAKDIKKQEDQVEDGWIQDHALIDEDGRARCSFHFCRKLFKDSTFLKKHLIKKHSEFLKAEVAKCHDTYMMTSWDKQEQRPVPPILVDCGRAFSSVPSPVLGAAEPMAADPEPELWRRQEERRKQDEEEEQARRERYNHHRQNNNNHHNNDDHHGPPPSLDAPLSEGRGGPRNNNNNNNFVDVDDMKEEKVEMAFDQVEIPTMEPPKKKKKKKKLL